MYVLFWFKVGNLGKLGKVQKVQKVGKGGKVWIVWKVGKVGTDPNGSKSSQIASNGSKCLQMAPMVHNGYNWL